MRDSALVHRLQNGESCFGSICFRNRGGVSGLSAKGWRYPEQLFVEQHDRRPVGPASARTLSMHGLNGGFELKSADAAMLESIGHMTFRLIH